MPKPKKRKISKKAIKHHSTSMEFFHSITRAIFFEKHARVQALKFKGKLTRSFMKELRAQVKGKLKIAEEFMRLPEKRKLQLAKADLGLFEDQHKKMIEDYLKWELRRLFERIDMENISREELIAEILRARAKVINEIIEEMKDEYCRKYLLDRVPQEIVEEFRNFIANHINILLIKELGRTIK